MLCTNTKDPKYCKEKMSRPSVNRHDLNFLIHFQSGILDRWFWEPGIIALAYHNPDLLSFRIDRSVRDKTHYFMLLVSNRRVVSCPVTVFYGQCQTLSVVLCINTQYFHTSLASKVYSVKRTLYSSLLIICLDPHFI